MTETCPICGQEFEDSDGRPASFKLAAHLRLKRDEAHGAYRNDVARETPEDFVPDEVTSPADSPYEAPSAEVRPQASRAAETGPAKPRKWWQRSNKEQRPTDPSGHRNETKPKRFAGVTGKREPAHEFLSDIYGGIGQLMGMATPYRVTGRALMINAPVAGYMLDDAVKGTVVDRMAVQPGVRLQNRYNSVSGLIEVPLLTFLIEQEQMKEAPDLIRLDRLFFMLRAALRRSIPAMAPAIKKMKQNEAKMAEAVRELYPDLQEGEDPAERMLAELFAFPVQESQPAPQEAPV